MMVFFRDFVSPTKKIGDLGTYGSLWRAGCMGIVTIDRTVSGTLSGWATLYEADLPGGASAAVACTSPLLVDSHPDAVMAASVSGSKLSIANRTSIAASFGDGARMRGCIAFPMA